MNELTKHYLKQLLEKEGKPPASPQELAARFRELWDLILSEQKKQQDAASYLLHDPSAKHHVQDAVTQEYAKYYQSLSEAFARCLNNIEVLPLVEMEEPKFTTWFFIPRIPPKELPIPWYMFWKKKRYSRGRRRKTYQSTYYILGRDLWDKLPNVGKGFDENKDLLPGLIPILLLSLIPAVILRAAVVVFIGYMQEYTSFAEDWYAYPFWVYYLPFPPLIIGIMVLNTVMEDKKLFERELAKYQHWCGLIAERERKAAEIQARYKQHIKEVQDESK